MSPCNEQRPTAFLKEVAFVGGGGGGAEQLKSILNGRQMVVKHQRDL